MSEGERFALDRTLLKLKNRRRKRRAWGKRLLILAAAWVLCFQVFGICVVQGQSMRPAYQDGDVVCFLRVFPQVKYGDVVIVDNGTGTACIKRIAGLPGDTVIVDDTGRVIRNGSPAKEPDVIYGTAGTGETQTFFVPEGSYFYLGDNRPRSRDSRKTGCADRKQIRGKVILTLRR